MKKRFFGILLTLVLLITCIAPAGALAETITGALEMPNEGGSLHLRSKASKLSKSAGYVLDGDSLRIDLDDAARDNENELWVKVKVARTGKSGYIKTKYIGRSAGPFVYVNPEGGSLKVRSGPGTGYSIAGYASHREPISVISRGETWSKIKVTRTGVTGYIMTKYIFGYTVGVTVPPTASAPTETKPAITMPTKYDAASIMTRTAYGVVNVRKGAGTGYASVAKLSRGDKLAVTGKSGDWYKVQTAAGKTGYVRKDYVSFGVTTKTTGEVNFRKGPGTNYTIIRELSKGASVIVHSVDGRWAKVTYSGKSGYLHMSYLNLFG